MVPIAVLIAALYFGCWNGQTDPAQMLLVQGVSTNLHAIGKREGLVGFTAVVWLHLAPMLVFWKSATETAAWI